MQSVIYRALETNYPNQGTSSANMASVKMDINMSE
jgi:hypothetical protein